MCSSANRKSHKLSPLYKMAEKLPSVSSLLNKNWLYCRFWVDCLQSSHSVQTSKFLWRSCPRVYHWPRARLDETQVTVIYSRAIVVSETSECGVMRVIGKIWTGTLANTADPDQTPQNAASDQGLHCLLNKRKLKVKWNSLKFPFRTIFRAYTQRQSTNQCCQYFDHLWYCTKLFCFMKPGACGSAIYIVPFVVLEFRRYYPW